MDRILENSVTDPITGNTYSLKHLKPLDVTYEIRINGKPVKVTLSVHFSAHCYTRSRKNEDLDEAVICRETKRGGVIDERAFNEERWGGSKKRPEIRPPIVTI